MTLWTPQKQFDKHEAGKSKQVQRGQLAFNSFGRPEAMFVYGNDRTTEKEFTVDIDMAQVLKEGATPSGRGGVYQPKDYNVDIVGAQFLCPKCYSPLYVRGKGLENGKEIHVLWSNMVRSNNDGLFRPLIEVDGVLKCDYYDHEIIEGGAATKSTTGISMRCGWMGGIIGGRCLDHKGIIGV